MTNKPIWTPIKIRLGDIEMWEDNPRMSTKAQAQRIIKSESEFGQPVPFALSPFDKNGKAKLYDGHQRVSAWLTVYGEKHIFFRSYLTASCMGVLNYTKIRFNEEFKVKEDYEMGLRCVKEDGGFLAARYFFWENSHWTDDGGCKDYRTQEMEMDAINKLMKMYPNSIRKVTRGGSKYSIHLDF